MGTRGSFGVITKEGDYKASYNHYDSYPSGLGQEVVDSIMRINENKNWDIISKKFSELELVDSNEEPSDEMREKYSKYTNPNVNSGQGWYSVLRELQGSDILDEISNGSDINHMIDGRNFIKDSLWCEWAYIVNLQNMTLEVFKGFQNEPQKYNRFGEVADGDYYPCALIKRIPLEKVNEDIMDEIENMEDENGNINIPNPWLQEVRELKLSELID